MFNVKTANTILYCENWKECVAFYKTQLGLNITTKNDWFVEFKLTESARLSMANVEKTTTKSAKGKGITITLEVEDLEESYESLIAAGLKPTPIKDHSWGAKVFYIFDPEGNRVEFWTSLACSEDKIGDETG